MHSIRLTLIIAAVVDWGFNLIVDARSYSKLIHRPHNPWLLVPRGGSTAAKKAIVEEDPQHTQFDTTLSNASYENEDISEYQNTLVTKRDGKMEPLNKDKVRYICHDIHAMSHAHSI